MEINNTYSDKIATANEKLRKTKVNILRISTLRVILFLCGIVGLFLFYKYGSVVIIGVILLTFVPFLALVKYHNKLFYRKEWYENVIKINQDEICALNNDLSPFDGGEEFINSQHRYTFDLDVFGNNHSLFQALNRTSTIMGKNKLAEWINDHLEDRDTINKRQEAIKEISELINLREKFRVIGRMNGNNNITEADSIKEWINDQVVFANKKWVRFMLWFAPILNITLFILYLFNILPIIWFGLAFGSLVIFSFKLIKSVTAVQYFYEKKLKILAMYAALIGVFDEHKFNSQLLTELKSEFYHHDKSSKDILAEASGYLEKLDLRNNQLLYVILEGSMLWQLKQITAIEKWKLKYGNSLIEWLDTLGKVDALLSLGNFAYNNSSYVYPSISTEPFVFIAEEMGHPLMNKTKCVKNGCNIPIRPFFIIITGANMAGKSTYLRTLGVNYLLACIGSPVCCKSMQITPAKLITSLRTSDSLNNNESYFFAELKRLRNIIDLLYKDEQLFIILDEILKGTNSVDKQKGSFALIRQFINLNANGIIATHDLKLAELKDIFPQNIKNNCFDAIIKDNELTFSYKINEGVAHNMNACFLMKKMGIIIE